MKYLVCTDTGEYSDAYVHFYVTDSQEEFELLAFFAKKQDEVSKRYYKEFEALSKNPHRKRDWNFSIDLPEWFCNTTIRFIAESDDLRFPLATFELDASPASELLAEMAKGWVNYVTRYGDGDYE